MSDVAEESVFFDLAPLTRVFALGDAERCQFAGPASASTISCSLDLLRDLLKGLPRSPLKTLCQDLSRVHGEARVLQLVDTLRSKNLIVARAVTPLEPQDYLFHLAETMGGGHAKKNTVAGRVIGLCGDEAVAAEVGTLAEKAGFQITQEIDTKANMVVACSATPNHTLFRSVNRRTLALQIPLLCAYIDWYGVALLAMHPGASACFECFYHRMRASRSFVPEFDAAHSMASLLAASPGFDSPVLTRLLAGMTVAHAISVLSGNVEDLHEAPLRSYSVLTGKQTLLPTLKLPRCPVCGPGNLTRPITAIYSITEEI